MRKIAFGLVLSILLTFSGQVVAEVGMPHPPAATEVDKADNNAIDKVFAKSLDQAENTVEINYVNELYLEAWKAEMANVSGLVKNTFTHKEDKQRLDDYVAAYESLAQKAFDLEMLNWMSCDLSDPIADRSFGSGATGASMMAQANIYKQATLNLIDYIQTNPDSSYNYIYKGTGPDLDQMRMQ